MRIFKVSLVIVFVSLFYGCMGSTTDDPEKAFRLWTGINKENTAVKVLHGRYWESGHITYEYEAVFKLIAQKEWVNQLIEFNDLKPSEEQYIRGLLNGVTLDWYKPTPDYKMYTNHDKFPDLYLWIHPSSDTIYVFNSQL